MRTLSVILYLFFVATTVHGAGYTPDQVRSAVRTAGGPERFLAKIAADTAKMSGRMIDDKSELIGSISRDRSLVYYTRVTTHTKSEIGNLATLRKQIASLNSPMICTAPIASILIAEFGAEYKYIVYSKTREHLFEYSFTRITCAVGYQW